MADAKVVHFEVTGKDQKALQGYYGDLFGWKFNTDFPGGYGMTDPSQTGVIVGVGDAQPGAPAMVTGYITVADINATLAKAESLGGKTVVPRFSPDGNSHLALVADPGRQRPGSDRALGSRGPRPPTPEAMPPRATPSSNPRIAGTPLRANPTSRKPRPLLMPFESINGGRICLRDKA